MNNAEVLKNLNIVREHHDNWYDTVQLLGLSHRHLTQILMGKAIPERVATNIECVAKLMTAKDNVRQCWDRVTCQIDNQRSPLENLHELSRILEGFCKCFQRELARLDNLK